VLNIVFYSERRPVTLSRMIDPRGNELLAVEKLEDGK
jgi:hypothetical protein